MTFSKEYQIDVPDSFPIGELDNFMASARRITLANGMSAAWLEFGGASNLIGWRYRQCHEEMTYYLQSWQNYGGGALHEELYQRERALFGTFSAGVSSIESTCYAIHALASNICFAFWSQRTTLMQSAEPPRPSIQPSVVDCIGSSSLHSDRLSRVETVGRSSQQDDASV